MAAGSGVATHALSGGRSSSWDDGDGGGWRSGGRRAGGRSSSGADSKEIISMRARVEYIKTNRGDWGVIEVEVLSLTSHSTDLTSRQLPVTEDREYVSANGPVLVADEGDVVEMIGVWENKGYGEQFKVKLAVLADESEPAGPRNLPGDAKGVVEYLQRELRGVGLATANAMVEAFGADGIQEVLDSSECADRRELEAGFKGKLARSIAEQWRTKTATEGPVIRAAIQLTRIGLDSAKHVSAVLDHFGRDAALALAAVQLNPWVLARVRGVGWAVAEKVAFGLGKDPGSEERGQEALMQALKIAEGNGDTGLRWADLELEALRAMYSDWPWPEDAGDGALERCAKQLRSAGRIVIESKETAGADLPWDADKRLKALREAEGPWEEDAWCCRRQLWRWEWDVAERLAVLAAHSPQQQGEGGSQAREASKSAAEELLAERPGIFKGLSAAQSAAVLGAVTSPVFALTGGPGCGKTFTVRAIVNALLAQGESVALCAPTGRAAQLLQKAVGRSKSRKLIPASTVHRLLGAMPEGALFDKMLRVAERGGGSDSGADSEGEADGEPEASGAGGTSGASPFGGHAAWRRTLRRLGAGGARGKGSAAADAAAAAAAAAGDDEDEDDYASYDDAGRDADSNDSRGGGRWVFEHTKSSPLPYGAVLVDEASMLSAEMAARLITALRPGARLILVGDADQLPPVSPGNPFAAALASGLLPRVHLSQVFRHRANSAIISGALRANEGLMPDDMVVWEAASGNKADVSSIINAGLDTGAAVSGAGGGAGGPNLNAALLGLGTDALWLQLPDGVEDAAVAEAAAEVVKRVLVGRGMEEMDIQVISPTKKNAAGVAQLNPRLQVILNPPGRTEAPASSFKNAATWRQGDRVVQTVNDYERDISNGDIGVLSALEPNKRRSGVAQAIVTFEPRPGSEEPHKVKFDSGKDLNDNVIHAYAMTVHKAQGGEFPVVVMVVPPTSMLLQTRPLLYTALSRARDVLVLVATRSSVAKCLRDLGKAPATMLPARLEAQAAQGGLRRLALVAPADGAAEVQEGQEGRQAKGAALGSEAGKGEAGGGGVGEAAALGGGSSSDEDAAAGESGSEAAGGGGSDSSGDDGYAGDSALVTAVITPDGGRNAAAGASDAAEEAGPGLSVPPERPAGGSSRSKAHAAAAGLLARGAAPKPRRARQPTASEEGAAPLLAARRARPRAKAQEAAPVAPKKPRARRARSATASAPELDPEFVLQQGVKASAPAVVAVAAAESRDGSGSGVDAAASGAQLQAAAGGGAPLVQAATASEDAAGAAPSAGSTGASGGAKVKRGRRPKAAPAARGQDAAPVAGF